MPAGNATLVVKKNRQLLLIFVDPVAPLAHIGISTYGSGVI